MGDRTDPRAAHTHITLKRVLRAVREDLENRDHQAHSAGGTRACRWAVYHIPPEGGRGAGDRGGRRGALPRRRRGDHAGQLWDDEVLHDVPEGCELLGSQLYEPARVGGRERLLHEGGSDDLVSAVSLEVF